MPATDFITALGRLLNDGALRDAFAADSVVVMRQLELRESDRAEFLRLAPGDLEFQARVLLRKRFDLVRRALPRTCGIVGADAWPEFFKFARCRPTGGGQGSATDALAFCDHLRDTRGLRVCAQERARVRFAGGRRRIAIHLASGPVVQIFFRSRARRWHEWMIYFRV
jgi:hypothetical protein